MALYMESTTIDESKTIGEITSALVGAGAKAINTEYGPDRRIIAVRFVLNVNGCDAVFHLGRVAWRQILRWVQAQLALIETGMVEPAEPFSPYMVDKGRQELLTTEHPRGPMPLDAADP